MLNNNTKVNGVGTGINKWFTTGSGNTKKTKFSVNKKSIYTLMSKIFGPKRIQYLQNPPICSLNTKGGGFRIG